MLRFAMLTALALTACDPAADVDSTTDTDSSGSTLDPDVNNFVPDHFPPADPVRVVFLGDSITAGHQPSWGISNLYRSLLEENSSHWSPEFDGYDIPGLFPSATEFINVSQGGATTDTLISSQLPALESRLTFPAAGETIIIFTVGGNDAQGALVGDADAILGRVENNFETITDWLLDASRFPDGAYIYLTNIYEPSNGVGRSECFFTFDYGAKLPKLEEANAGLVTMGEEKGFAVVDLYGHFKDHGFNADDFTIENYDADDPTNWFEDDCLHPTRRASVIG